MPIGLGLSAFDERPVADVLRDAALAEEHGYDAVFVPEAWGRDAFATLGAIATRTSRVLLGTGIVNVFSRSAAVLAMAAATLDELSGGRFVLGLGVSGAAVIEGFHGVPMRDPLKRLRETTEAVRALVRRDRAGYAGEVVRVAPGFTLRFHPPRERVPVWHASLTPAAIRQCGEIADGWLPYLLPPAALREDAALLDAGLARSGRARRDVTVAPFIPALVLDDLARARDAMRAVVGFYLGGMGRHYHDVVARHGFGDVAALVKERWTAGKRQAAIAAVSDELVDAVTLCGPAARCRARLAAYRDAGADLPVILIPPSASAEETAATIGALV